MSQDDSDRADQGAPVARLERQVERGSFFTHSLVSQFADRINEIEPLLYGLIDALVARGLLAQDDLAAASAAVRDELVERSEEANPGLAIRTDDGAVDPVPVDCERRMPICRSVCCRLDFALTVEEIESGGVRWDLGQPYFIRHEADGYCTHRRAENDSCSIYEQRPTICRRYSCAKDTRIWKDFDRMELNHEWLDSLPDERPRLIAATMLQPDDPPREVAPPRDGGE